MHHRSPSHRWQSGSYARLRYDNTINASPATSRTVPHRRSGRYFLDAANTATYAGHEVVNLRLGWSPREDLRTSLRVDNLFDTAYADRADYAFGNYRYFPGRGRALFLSVDFASH